MTDIYEVQKHKGQKVWVCTRSDFQPDYVGNISSHGNYVTARGLPLGTLMEITVYHPETEKDTP